MRKLYDITRLITPPPKENLADWNKQNNGTLGYTQGPPVIKNQQKLKSRVGQFLRLLHKNFCLASDQNILQIKKLRISKKWLHAKFQQNPTQIDRVRAKKPLKKRKNLQVIFYVFWAVFWL